MEGTSLNKRASARPDGAGGEKTGHVPRGGIRVAWRLNQMSEDKASGQLATNLLGQRVAELDRAVCVILLPLGLGRSRELNGSR